MLDIGWSELLVIAIVAIVVVGPKDLPKMMRSIGFYAGKLRRAAADFQRQFEEAMAESEADEVRKNIESIRSGFGGLKPEADKPLMTGERARTALDAPPLAAHEVEPPAKRKPKRAPQTKRAQPESKKAASTASPKQAKPKAKAKTKAESKS
jgi:sec-independent protein translocase protein TatB